MTRSIEPGVYDYAGASLNDSHAYLLPRVMKTLAAIAPRGSSIFDLGCGNGSVGNELMKGGYRVMGVDASEQGISAAKSAYPQLSVQRGSVYDEGLAVRYGQFDVVLSLEVIEHLHSPRQFLAVATSLLKPSGHLILSTPYHGYLKNLVLAVTGTMDRHFTALMDDGHIKFWSIRTLSALVVEFELEVVQVHRVGRIGPLAKSMIFVASRRGAPAADAR